MICKEVAEFAGCTPDRLRDWPFDDRLAGKGPIVRRVGSSDASMRPSSETRARHPVFSLSLSLFLTLPDAFVMRSVLMKTSGRSGRFVPAKAHGKCKQKELL